jgi:LPXTG-motif cell wall-anchored protein
VSSTGLATAVWRRNNGSNFIIQSSTSQNGGAWSTPVDLSATGGSSGSPQLTVDSTGLATAVWFRDNGSNWIIQSSQILNPIPSQPTPTPPTLAKTGAEVDWLLLGSLIAVVAGAGSLTFSRRKRTQ